MATTIAVSCPECHKQIKAPPEVQGKKIRCKACGHVFVVKAARAGQTRPEEEDLVQVTPLEDEVEVQPQAEDKDALDQVKAVPARKRAAPAKKKKDDDEADSNPYDVTNTDLATRCPYCAGALEEGQVICL